jgi:hypothetical protein
MACKREDMKAIVIIIGFVLIGSPVFSQTEVMIEQIIKLKTYLSWLKKGYDIANKGLTLIGDIKHGDFNLHKDYFNSLEQVNHQIKGDVKIAAMISMQIQMLSSYKSYHQQFKASGVFTSKELNYLYQVFTVLLDDVEKDITELTNVITDDQLQMKDDQRIDDIDKLYRNMTDKYEFLYSFSSEVQLQVFQRQRELEESHSIQKMY